MSKQLRFRHTPLTRARLSLALAALCCLLPSFIALPQRQGHAASPRQTLSLEERVNAQRALEEVYWRHRLWPQDNPQPKPALDAVLPAAALRAKVEDYLRLSNALEQYWQRPVTGEQLQAELERMARETKQPEVLRELWAALGNDPLLIAECLIRPLLAERLAREADEQDKSQRLKAELKTPTHQPSPISLSNEWWSSGNEHTERLTVAVSNEYQLPVIESAAVPCGSDAWRVTNPIGAPIARYLSSAVWTGSEMIIWGGLLGGSPTYLNTGARYNPATDTWTPTNTPGAPRARSNHTAVWTGTEMIVWGGWNGFSTDSTGGRYNPMTNAWAPTNTSTAPLGRYVHSVVWTGSEMIIWGGFPGSGGDLNTGGRYNPTTNLWTATNMTGAPSARESHSAVWNGSEMIVWGGFSSGRVNTGGRYNPTTNSWLATSTANAPAARSSHSAVWTGNAMIIWGGSSASSTYVNTGGRYNVVTDSWESVSAANAPAGRQDYTTLWTGREMIIWGGQGSDGYVNTGGLYNPTTNSWALTTSSNAPLTRGFHTAVWTGSEMVVWGGANLAGVFSTGGRYAIAASLTLSPTSQSFPAVGGTGSLAVAAQGDCTWAATSNADWLTITSGGHGSGNGTINYSVVVNTTTSPRTGTLTITGQTFTVAQAAGSACPTISSIAPTSSAVGNPVTITGTGLTGVTAVRFANNVSATFNINSDTQITATVPSNAITGPITLSKPNCNDVQTGAFTVTPPPNPVPTLTQINPNTATAGNAGFTLTLNGTNFSNSSVVRWNGNDRTMTFVSATQLSATIPASDITTAGTASVTVFTPLPGGGVSNALSFTITAPPNLVPALTSLEPNTRMAGSAGFTLALNGSGFSSASQVKWNGAERLTSFINSTRLTIDVAASDIATAGTASLTVVNPAPGGGTSAAQTFTITQPSNPVPALASLNPSAALAGSPSITLTLNGTNFINGSVVRWNNNNRTTTFVDNTRLTAALPASDLTSAGTAQVTVFNPAPSGGTSNTLNFTINQNPRVVRVVPVNAVAGNTVSVPVELAAQGDENGVSFSLNFDPALLSNPQAALGSGAGGATLTLNASQTAQGRLGVIVSQAPGQSFSAGARQILLVRFNAAPVMTATSTNVSFGDQPAAREITDASARVLPALFTPGAVSITPPNPAPTLSQISPNSALAGGAGFTLTVTGANFINGSIVRWSNAERQTTFVSATQLTAQIPASDVTTAGAASVTVFNPAPGGGTSNAQSFNINNPVPTLTSVNPNSAAVSSQGFALTVNGTNFVSGAVVRWNGAERATTFVSHTQLSAAITAADLANAGTAQVTVFNPAPGGGASNTLSFTINNLAPSIANLTPSLVIAGGAAFMLTVNGANFVNDSVVRWQGNARATTFVSATRLTAAILASDIAMAGTARVSVFNPAPGGGASNEVSVTIGNPVANVSAASFLGAELAADSIVSAFGAGLATRVESAATTPLPTTLAGTTVKLRDSAGVERLAPLFFVAPQQINYLVPAGTAAGLATVIITSGDGSLSIGTTQIAAVAPSLFAANANGQGVPAALGLRVKADGAQSFEPVAQLDAATGRFVPAPIELGPAGEQVFLILFGTGWRGRSALTAVTCRIGGVSVPVTFAGAQGDLVGLDQINIGPLPRNLAGRGEVDLVLTVDGKAANTVRIAVK